MRDSCFDVLGLASHPRIVWDPPADASPSTGMVISENPATRQAIAGVKLDDVASYDRTLDGAVKAFESWRNVPAPADNRQPTYLLAPGLCQRKCAANIQFHGL